MIIHVVQHKDHDGIQFYMPFTHKKHADRVKKAIDRKNKCDHGYRVLPVAVAESLTEEALKEIVSEL